MLAVPAPAARVACNAGAAQKPCVAQENPTLLGATFSVWQSCTGLDRSSENQIVLMAFRCTPFTALPDGSSIFANSCDQRNAAGVEHAIDGPTGTVRQAVEFLKKLSK